MTFKEQLYLSAVHGLSRNKNLVACEIVSEAIKIVNAILEENKAELVLPTNDEMSVLVAIIEQAKVFMYYHDSNYKDSLQYNNAVNNLRDRLSAHQTRKPDEVL